MDWFKLKENKCPKCGKDITKGMIVDTASRTVWGGARKSVLMGEETITSFIIHRPCGFKISESRYKEIVASTIKQELLAEKWRKEDERHNDGE